MTFRRYKWGILLQVLLLFIVLCAEAYFVNNQQYLFAVVCLPVIIYLVWSFYRFHKKAETEVSQFVESVRYRDFSRYFDEKHAPSEFQILRKGFNEINSTFKIITKERETQYQYLQKILELVDTGILSYELNTGEIGWINESFKKMFGIPYLKTVHSLEKRDENLYMHLIRLNTNEHEVVTINKEQSSLKILLSATLFQTDGKIFKLIAFQNVSEALDETESKAWQRLLSVMTHEIMNSIAPISSLAETLKNRLEVYGKENGNIVPEDFTLGVETIKKRSEGLLKFAEAYRNFNKITTPNLQKVYIRDLFENLHTLMQPTLLHKNIELNIVLKDPSLMIDVDTSLIEQLLINLLVNAIDAVKEISHPSIILSGYIQPNNRPVLKIADNGSGMSPEVADKIFIPFFSTKKTGSGIGLSLCKQIMLLHKGNIQVQSREGEGTVFTLYF
ncbi:sensor histidine kinase [Pinibacter soli]|uniref:histidine kinase n=1 Tax=Pinibacter soli TaxID=3044211 RepID=A0ABT6RGN1_9BACT|nr:HAMP domain-containing sensor histidine kinase [Pinibacter soli]MDI3321703.1 HAMP domain-containing sensor histidine kinase [Pinibacter soli]